VFLARVQHTGPDGPEARIVASADPTEGWIDVRRAERLRLERSGATSRAARRLAQTVAPSSLTAALENGPAFREAVEHALSHASAEAPVAGEARFLIPVDPPAYRDFMAFERHFRFGSELRGLPVPDVLYEMPVSYFGNPFAFVGPDAEVPWPHYTQHMDYELELGIVIGRDGRDIEPQDAGQHVLGVTILNDFSARDIQLREMTGGLGPSKGKHFGSALGPWIATLDELPPEGVRMRARVNGDLWSDASSAEMIWSIEEIVAWAMAAEPIAAGTVLGSGTANGGSAIELGRKLAPGDDVELAVDRLGVLRTRLGQPGGGWMPAPRKPTEQKAPA